MESWQFIQSPAGEWYWLCSNVISHQTRESAATFKTRMECMANAMNSGYQKLASGAAAPAEHYKPPSPGAQGQRYPAGQSGAQATRHQSPQSEAQATAKRVPRRNRNKSGKQGKAN